MFSKYLVRVGSLLSLAFLGFTTVYVFVQVIGQDKNTLKTVVSKHFLAVTGTPLAALSATPVLAMFRAGFGDIEFEIPGFKFKGSSGPAILWIICFLAFVVALRLLWTATRVAEPMFFPAVAPLRFA